MSYTAMDIVFLFAHSLSGILGIFGNSALLFAIKFRSPSAWKSFSILLSNSAIIDLVACVSSVMSMERQAILIVAAFKEVTATIYLGPCSLVSDFACHVHCKEHKVQLLTN
ncbi:hypothetical protein PRIPAC_79920 [Pristionchus pacificus]|uniref:G protein-coupled receptor n=1 Tax=Pristionchus pacificus TaxID=54126 RepID=A0A2A6C394_PRIPA|nr:hypothetical protein PRIPAC_79920 [Pristionchus pacificus]|eukprot:PDM72600.1 G protein-coupled receptor [Pristionchus pacificus]